MKKLLVLAGFIIAGLQSFSQSTGRISGSIKDGGNQKVIDAATISLLRSRDS
jgi:hypothetical protein